MYNILQLVNKRDNMRSSSSQYSKTSPCSKHSQYPESQRTCSDCRYFIYLYFIVLFNLFDQVIFFQQFNKISMFETRSRHVSKSTR